MRASRPTRPGKRCPLPWLWPGGEGGDMGRRPGVRSGGGVGWRAVQHPRRDPLPARARQRGFLAMSSDVVMFFALLFVAAAIAGATACVIFWPLALVHLRDRHPGVKAQLGDGAFLKPDALWWL